MKLKDATKPLTVTITPKCVEKARSHRKDKNFCVVAQALLQQPGIEKVEVGARTVRVQKNGKTIRYITPEPLRVGLNLFDSTGEWLLPKGNYTLQPPTAGRTLKAQGDYEKKWRKRKLAKAKSKPGIVTRMKLGRPAKAKNQFTHRPLNARVIEFAQIRKARYA